MSAAENRPPNKSSSQSKPLSSPPKRPSLRKPPARPDASPSTPQPPPSPAAETVEVPAAPAAPAAAETEPPEVTTTPSRPCNHPIAPPSEPMQYRAIGLVRGTYQPSEEQLNRGNIVTTDGAIIDSVLLGRITSLIKKHIDLDSAHLWVVYPRTRQPSSETEEEANDGALHLQIVGIWEPETLGLPGENPKTQATEADDEAAIADARPDTPTAASESAVAAADSTVDPAAPSENYFSVRGEVLNYDEEAGNILVKIVQGARRSNKPPKAFKLNLWGQISGKTVGYFWEFDVERQDDKLVVTDGRSIRLVPPKKKKKRRSPPPRGGKRPGSGSDRPYKPARNSDRPRVRPPAPVKSNPL